MRSPQSELPHIAADILERVRQRRPRVHCITNAVAQTFTANVLLAAGAVPSMTIAPKEVGGSSAAPTRCWSISARSTPSGRRRRSPPSRWPTRRKPWVLDPVFIDRSAPRAAFAKRLLAKKPRALRLNERSSPRSAAMPGHGRVHPSAARAHRDRPDRRARFRVRRQRLATVANGDPLMAKVTAMGCAGSALVAACLAVETDAWRATAAGLIALGVAGEIAAARARGPGSFAMGSSTRCMPSIARRCSARRR